MRSYVAVANRSEFRPLLFGKLYLTVTVDQPLADLHDLLKFIASKKGNVNDLQRSFVVHSTSDDLS